MFTAVVSAIHEDAGTIQVVTLGNGRVIDDMNAFSVGNRLTGLFYMPSVGDMVLVDTEDSFVAFITNTSVSSPAFKSTTKPSLHEGELLLVGKAGQVVKFNGFGDIVLVPGPTGRVWVGTVSVNDTDDVPGQPPFNARAVVRDGDTATGTDSRGDAVTVTIHATSKRVWAG